MPKTRETTTHARTATRTHATTQPTRAAVRRAALGAAGAPTGSSPGSVVVMVSFMGPRSVRAEGLEPSRLSTPGPKPGASACSATPACKACWLVQVRTLGPPAPCSQEEMGDGRRRAPPAGDRAPAVAPVGSLPGRAGVGHGAGGLQPGRPALDLLPARPRPL